MEDATVTFLKSRLADDTDRLAKMERHLNVMEENRKGLLTDVDRTKKAIDATKGMLADMQKPAAPAPATDDKAKA